MRLLSLGGKAILGRAVVAHVVGKGHQVNCDALGVSGSAPVGARFGSADRFTYWPVRLARGGPALAPGSPDDLVQWIDVRDLAQWLLASAVSGVTGVYDGVGVPTKRGEFLAAVGEGVRVTTDLVWVDQQFLLDHEVAPWMGPRSLPLWLPLPEFAGFLTRDPSPALAAGLVSRPVADTAAATPTWYDAAGGKLKSGLAPADEALILDAWRTSQVGLG